MNKLDESPNFKYHLNRKCKIHSAKFFYVCCDDICINSGDCFLCQECIRSHFDPHKSTFLQYQDLFSFSINEEIEIAISQEEAIYKEIQTSYQQFVDNIDSYFDKFSHEIIKMFNRSKELIKMRFRNTTFDQKWKFIKDDIKVLQTKMQCPNIEKDDLINFINTYSQINSELVDYKSLLDQRAIENKKQTKSNNELINFLKNEMENMFISCKAITDKLDIIILQKHHVNIFRKMV